jgi:hypothetical protein
MTDEYKTRFATAYSMALARKYANNSSSTLCASDAQDCYDEGELEQSYRRSVASLSHSVGIFHAVYIEVAGMERVFRLVWGDEEARVAAAEDGQWVLDNDPDWMYG